MKRKMMLMMSLQSLQLKAQARFSLDLITLTIDELLILSVASKWSRW